MTIFQYQTMNLTIKTNKSAKKSNVLLQYIQIFLCLFINILQRDNPDGGTQLIPDHAYR